MNRTSQVAAGLLGVLACCAAAWAGSAGPDGGTLILGSARDLVTEPAVEFYRRRIGLGRIAIIVLEPIRRLRLLADDGHSRPVVLKEGAAGLADALCEERDEQAGQVYDTLPREPFPGGGEGQLTLATETPGL